MKPISAALAILFALTLGFTPVGYAAERGGHGGGPAAHGGSQGHGGGPARGGFQGHGGGFRGHDGGFQGHPGGFHGHGHFHGGFIGVSPFIWAPGYVYAPPVYVDPGPVYVDPGSNGYWYYCQSLGGYYPNVPSCPEPWVTVPAN
jgi:hypothetical protein